MATLVEQIRAQGGDWNIGGIDRAQELADLLSRQGITSLDGLALNKEVIPGSWQEGGSGGETPDAGYMSADSFKHTLTAGGKTIGFAGDYNNDGSYGGGKWEGYDRLQDINGDENSARVGWSARGDGGVSYNVEVGADGQARLVPVWGSTSDKDRIQRGLVGAAGVIAAPFALNAALGAAGLGGNALAAADPLAGYMTTGGVEGSFGAGNALAGGAPGATSYGVGADVFGTAAGATPTAGVYGAGAGEAAMGLGGAGTLTGGVGGSAGGVMGGIGDFLGGVSPGQWLNVGGNLLGGYLGDKAAGNAADAQLASGREANALQKYMYDTTRADYAPYRAAGTTALGQIQALLKDPGSITKDPGYLFGLGEGRNTLENSASARGMTYSGAQAKALQRFGQDYAGTKLDQTYNRLAGVAGIGQTATGGTALAGANYGNRVGETLQGMGNVRGSGYVGGANAWGNALSQIANGFQTDEMIKRFGG